MVAIFVVYMGVMKMVIGDKFNKMNKILNNFKILFIVLCLYSCQNNNEANKSIIFIDCTNISNNLGDVYGLIIKHDSIYSCVRTNTIDKSVFKYSAFERESNNFDDFVDNLTKLADEYDQTKNVNVIDGAKYVLIVKNDSIEKKYYLYSYLMTDSLFDKIKMFKDYSKFSDFKPTNKFDFPTNEMCIDTIPEPKFW